MSAAKRRGEYPGKRSAASRFVRFETGSSSEAVLASQTVVKRERQRRQPDVPSQHHDHRGEQHGCRIE